MTMQAPVESARADHERAHGRMLAASDPEAIWGWKTPAGRRRARRRARLIAAGGELRPGSHVLEIGCGTGMFTAMFAKTGAHILAVDISPELIERARARGLPGNQVQFFDRPFEACDVDGPFDAIIGSSVIHHLDVEASLRKMFALLRPNGKISFAEPNLLNPQVFLERKLRFLPWFSYVSPDEAAFVRWSLARRLRRLGFVDVLIQPFDWLHPKTPRLLIPVIRGLGWVLEHLPGTREFSGSLFISARRPAENRVRLAA